MHPSTGSEYYNILVVFCKNLSPAVSVSVDQLIKVWNGHTGVCVNTLEGHVNGVWADAMNGQVLATGSNDDNIRIWNSDTSECFNSLRTTHDLSDSVRGLTLQNEETLMSQHISYSIV